MTTQLVCNASQSPHHSTVSLRGPLPPPWRFVVFEGLDGSGKTSVAREVANRCGAVLLETPMAELAPYRQAIDKVVGERGLARTLWYATHVALAADKASSILAKGGRVVMARYWMSTLAYAAAQGHPIDLEGVLARLVKPDATVLLNVPLPVRRDRAVRRATGLHPHDIEFFDESKEQRLYAHYRRLAKHSAAGRFVELLLEDAPLTDDVDLVLKALDRVTHPPLMS